jgi:hypothetical protein
MLEDAPTDPTFGEPASCIPIVRGSCDLLGDLEQQPEATVTSAFVMLMGSPAAMEAAAREATAASQMSLPSLTASNVQR